MANAIGWLKLYRDLLGKPIWLNSTPEQKCILIAILCMVNHEPNVWEWQGEKYSVSRGQTITSLEKICKTAGKGISQQNVRTALKRFEKLQFLTNESTKEGRLLTVLNWRVYQSEDSKPNKAANRCLTDDSQTPNRRLTPIEECKNDNNEKTLFDVPEEKPKKKTSPKKKAEEIELELIGLYPEIDAEFEIKQMKKWLLARPKRKFTKAFAVNWLNKTLKEYHDKKQKQRSALDEWFASGPSDETLCKWEEKIQRGEPII